jgi:hypothetical protein
MGEADNIIRGRGKGKNKNKKWHGTLKKAGGGGKKRSRSPEIYTDDKRLSDDRQQERVRAFKRERAEKPRCVISPR